MEGCRGTESSRTNLRVQFSHRHPQDSILFPDKGNQHDPWRPQCDTFVPQEELNRVHPTSAMCRRGSERNLQRLVVEET